VIEIGIFAKTFAGSSPDEVLAAAARAGYTTVQYNMACSGLAAMPDRIAGEAAAAVAAASLANKVSIAAVSGTYNMIHPVMAVRQQGLARLEVLASRCKGMSASLVTLCTGTRDPDDQWRAHPENGSKEAWRDLLAAMETAIAIAERWGVDLGIEPELANVVSSAARADQLIRELRSERLRIVLDPANLFERESLARQRHIVSAAVDLLGDRIVMAHAKDRAADASFVAAGEGVIDFRHFIMSLVAAGFTGPLVAHGLSADEAPGVAAHLRDTLAAAGVEAA
jgi:sugar phosphate isomerase/epimerase